MVRRNFFGGLELGNQVGPIEFAKHITKGLFVCGSLHSQLIVPVLQMIGYLIEDFRLSFRFEIRSSEPFPDFDLPFKHVPLPRFGRRLRRTLAISGASPPEPVVPQWLAGSSGAV